MTKQKNYYKHCIFSSLILLIGALVFNNAPADIVYYESDGMVVGEGEIFSSRTNDGNGNGWFVVPDENAGAGTFTNARNNAFIQSLPDNGSGGGPIVPPEIRYQMYIFTPGIYRLYLRWECNKSVNGGGNSDSIYMDIVEFKDGYIPGTFGSPSNSIADWYEFTENGDGDFSTNPWESKGEAEVTGAGAADNSVDWLIPTQGIYTLRFTQREDGSAVDAFVFQRNNLPAPTGDGPAMSSLEKSRIVSIAQEDTFLRRSDTNAVNGASATMLLKNDTSTGPAGYDRDIYLRFDISEQQSLLEDWVATNATLSIYLIGDGVNTNHDIFVAVIAEDAAAEHFDELTLWPDSDPPSNNDVWSDANDEAIDWSKIYGGAPVGSFEISSSNEHTTIKFSTPELLQAIRDDNDGVISMVLYREIDDSNTDSFASKEHASYPPPVMEVNFWKPETGILILIY